MSYFKQFPTTSYDVNKDGVLDDVVDIFRYVDVKDNAITDLATYTWYDIKDGERPDVVSQKLYGTPKYYWTFFVVNDSLKHGLEDWPLSHHELEKFLEFNFDSNSVLKLKTKVQPYNREVIYPAEEGVGLDGLHQTETLPLYNFENTLNGLLLVEDVVIKNVDNSELALIQNYDSANNQLSIKKGTVSKINLEDAGSSYVMPPTVIFSKNTTGDTATALCAINEDGSIGLIEITSPGSGYQTVPTIQLFNGPDVPAELEISCDDESLINESVNIIKQGRGYRRIPTLIVSAPVISGGIRATAECSLSIDGEIETVTITNQGWGYSMDYPPFITIVVDEDSQGYASANIVDEEWISSLNRFSLSTAFINAQNNAASYSEFVLEQIRYGLEIEGGSGYVNLEGDGDRYYYPRFEGRPVYYEENPSNPAHPIKKEDPTVKALTRAGSGSEKPFDTKTIAKTYSIDFNMGAAVDLLPDEAIGFGGDSYAWTFSSNGPIRYEIKKDPLTPMDTTYYTYITYDTSGGTSSIDQPITKKRSEWQVIGGDTDEIYNRVYTDNVLYPTAGYAGNKLNGVPWKDTAEFRWSIGAMINCTWVSDYAPNLQKYLDLFTYAYINGVYSDGSHYVNYDESFYLRYNAITGKIDALYAGEFDTELTIESGVYDVEIIYGEDPKLYSSTSSSNIVIDFDKPNPERTAGSTFTTVMTRITLSGKITITLDELQIPIVDPGSAAANTSPYESTVGSYHDIINGEGTEGTKAVTMGLSPTYSFDIGDTMVQNTHTVDKLANYGSGYISSDASYNPSDPLTNYLPTNNFGFNTDPNFGTPNYSMDPQSIIKSWSYSYPLPTSQSVPYFTPKIRGSKYTYYQITFVLKTFEYDGTTVGAEVIDPAFPVKYYTGIFNTRSTGVAEVALGFDNFQGIGPIPTGYIKIAFLDKVNSVTPYKYDLTTEWYDPYMKWIKTYYPRIYDAIAEEPQSVLPDDTISPQLFALNAERVLIFDVEHQETLGRNGLCHYESEDGKYSSSGDVSSVDVVPISESEYALNVNLPSPFASVPETPTFVTVAECIEKENRAKTKIRVVKPEHINDFATSFRSLIQS